MALAATTHSAPTYSNINLVPLRVNVVSDDHTLSVVETLVLDRYCWPVPLFEPLEEAMDENAEELAYTLLSDLEVHGMGRTVRHFTGRVDLWTVSLHQKIKAQLIPQLRHVAKTTKLRIVKRDKKRKSDEDDEKQAKDKETKSSSSDAATKPTTTTVSKKEEEDPPAAPPKKKKKKASLVPVRLRLCVNGIRIHDDFIWDLNVPQCPIEFATSLGDDLNLPSEAIAAIVTSIVEQLDGSTVDDTKDLLDSTTTNSSGRKNATAAWALDHRVHISNMQHLLTMHRPTTTTTTTTTSTSHHVQTYGSG